MNINKEIAQALGGWFDCHRLIDRGDKIEYELPTCEPSPRYFIDFEPSTNWLQTSILLYALVKENISVIATEGKTGGYYIEITHEENSVMINTEFKGETLAEAVCFAFLGMHN